MKKQSRVAFLLLAIAMSALIVLGVMAFSMLSAKAESPLYTYLDKVTVSGVPKNLAVGEKLPQLNVSVPAGEKYTVSCEWKLSDGTPLNAASTIVENGKKYILRGKVTANAGYAFSYMSELFVDHENFSSWWDVEVIDGFVEYYFSVEYSFLKNIDTVNLNMNVPSLGAAFPSITVGSGDYKLNDYYCSYFDNTLGSEVYYDVSADKWGYYDHVNGVFCPVSDVFEKHAYEIYITVGADQGFGFSDGTKVQLNGGSVESLDNVEYSVEDETVYYYFSYDFRTPINKVEITVPSVEAGMVAPTPSIPANVNYKLAGNEFWYDIDGRRNLAAGDRFENGKRYSLNISIEIDAQYKIADEADFLINGKKAEAGWGDVWADVYGGIYDFTEKIDKVEVSLTLPEVSKPLSAATVSSEKHYKISSDSAWLDYRTGEEIAVGTVVEVGDSYYYYLVLSADSGYGFGENARVYLNGQLLGESYYSLSSMQIEFYLDAFDFTQTIKEVKVDYAELVAGEDFPQFKIPENAKYKIKKARWIDLYTGGEATGKVANGGNYRVYVELEPNVGYKFSSSALLFLNGEELDRYNISIGDFYIEFDVYLSLAKPIEKVEINYTVPAVGSNPSAITVASGKGYKLDTENTSWYNNNTYDKQLEAFADGGRYLLDYYVTAEKGYRFTDDTEVYINGKKSEMFRVSGAGVSLYGAEYYSFAKKINKLEAAIPAPQISKDILSENDIVLGSDVKYKVEDVEYYGEDIVYADNKRYEFTVIFVADSGYEFDKDVVVAVDAKNNISFDYSVDGNVVYVYLVYTFNEIIDKIEIPAFPSIKIGDKLESKSDIRPAGKKYTYSLMWMLLDERNVEGNMYIGAVKNGESYVAVLDAVPDEGYEFSEKVKVILGGKEYMGVMNMSNYNNYSFLKMYDFGGADIIETIEINAEKPEINSKPGKVTVKDNAGYKILQTEWLVSSKADGSDSDTQKSVWKNGDYAFVGVAIKGISGAYISPDAVIKLNGKEIPVSEAVLYYEGDRISLMFDMGKIAETPKETPATGDSVSAELCVALFAASAICAIGAICISKKRKGIER